MRPTQTSFTDREGYQDEAGNTQNLVQHEHSSLGAKRRDVRPQWGSVVPSRSNQPSSQVWVAAAVVLPTGLPTAAYFS